MLTQIVQLAKEFIRTQYYGYKLSIYKLQSNWKKGLSLKLKTSEKSHGSKY